MTTYRRDLVQIDRDDLGRSLAEALLDENDRVVAIFVHYEDEEVNEIIRRINAEAKV